MPRTKRNDLDKYNFVVQSNDLILHANWRLDLMSLKLYLMAISCINTSNPPKDNIIHMKKSEIIRFLQAAGETDVDYGKVKQAMLKIRETTVALDEGHAIRYVGMFNEVMWERDKDIVDVYISPSLMPFLVELRSSGGFLQYPLLNVQFFKSKYGLTMYQYLMAEWKRAQKRRIRVEITDLRHITDTKDKYPRFDRFEDRVLKAAVKDINQAEVDFTVSYEKVKMGKTIEFIDFYVCPQEILRAESTTHHL